MLLEFNRSKELLEKHSINFAPSEIFSDIAPALEYVEKIGYPVVAKIWGPDVLHRTERGGVRLNIKNQEELVTAFNDLKQIEPGILIQKMADPGQQVIVGIKRDKQFGPVIMFGLGGIFVEILKDVSFRICPINQKEAMEMIREIKGYPILTGARGETPVDIDALAKMIVSISTLATEEEDIKEIDFNPIIVSPNGAVAVDFKFLV